MRIRLDLLAQSMNLAPDQSIFAFITRAPDVLQQMLQRQDVAGLPHEFTEQPILRRSQSDFALIHIDALLGQVDEQLTQLPDRLGLG